MLSVVHGKIHGTIIIIVIFTMCGRELPPAPIRQVRPCQLPPFFIHHHPSHPHITHMNIMMRSFS